MYDYGKVLHHFCARLIKITNHGLLISASQNKINFEKRKIRGEKRLVINKDVLKKFKKELEEEEDKENKARIKEIEKKEIKSLTLKDKAVKKDKFILSEQKNYLQQKGIDFAGLSDSEITNLLSNSTYYFKLTTYRKNYLINAEGKYEGLSLKQLQDLATIDMYLRFIIIQMTLEIEHSLKTKVISEITQDSNEDGYTIIEEFNDYLSKSHLEIEAIKKKKREEWVASNTEIPYYLKEKTYTAIEEKIMARNSNITDYSYDLYQKRSSNPAIWVLIELMSYGQLGNFLEFYTTSKKRGYKEFKRASKFIKNTKKMRNAAAHNRPIIYDLCTASSIEGKLPIEMRQYLEHIDIEEGVSNEILRNIKLFDFLTILLLHDVYIFSYRMKEIRKEDLNKLITRCYKNKDIYNMSNITNQQFKNIFEILIKVVDHYGK